MVTDAIRAGIVTSNFTRVHRRILQDPRLSKPVEECIACCDKGARMLRIQGEL